MSDTGPSPGAPEEHAPKATWRRNQIAITVAASMIFFGFTLVTPFLPFYIESIGVHRKAAVALWSGLLLTITPLIAALLGPFWGRLADRVGMRVTVQRVLLTITAHWGLMFFTTEVWHVLVLRILLGLFSGFGTISVALVTHGCPRERIGRAVGTLQAAQILSTAIGPFLGGMLAETIGIRNTYLMTCALCAGATGLVMLLYRDLESTDWTEAPVVVSPAGPVSEGVRAVVPTPTGRAPVRPRRFRDILALPGFRPLLPLLFLVNLVERAFFLIVPLFLTAIAGDAGSRESTTGLVMSAGALAAAASAWMLGRGIAGVAPLQLLFWCLLAATLVVFAMALSGSIMSFAVLRVLFGLAIGGAATLLYTIAGGLIPNPGRAAAYSVLSSAAVLGGSLGPILCGLLSALSPRAPLIAGGAVYLVLTAGILSLLRRNDPFAAASPPGGRR